VVHEVNNPLAIIKNYLSILDGKLARQEPVGGELSILNEEIDRVGQLIGSLAEPQVPETGPRPVDAARVVDDVLRLFRTSGFVPGGVQIAAHMDGDSAIEGDPDVLKQILVNLVKNAVEAFGPQHKSGGRIEVVNRGHVNRERHLYVELGVSDNGPGLSREVLANLFMPVKSSKEGAPDGGKRGLGLSIVHGLVKKMGGHIACRSASSGTSFEILLPAYTGAGTALALPARALGSA
jgi:signal transduction histidine kinase